MHSHIGVVTDNMVAGTSSKVFIQFWNCYMNKRFLSYDYGAPANLRIYGTDTPVPPTPPQSVTPPSLPPPQHTSMHVRLSAVATLSTHSCSSAA